MLKRFFDGCREGILKTGGGEGLEKNLNVREACPGDSVSNALVAWAWLSSSGKASLVITRRNLCEFRLEMQNDARG